VINLALELVTRPGNDFSWSSWIDAKTASIELTQIKYALLRNDLSHYASLRSIFSPTGPLQELSLSSGWGEEYLRLAAQLDGVDWPIE
jgi:hypothetical protein